MRTLLSIIYPYRNRDLKRLQISLESLQQQSNKNFEVFFVDYGSEREIAAQVKKLCAGYSFVEYQYQPTQFQPWNKSKALNSVIKNLKTAYCFVADVDMIFHPHFIEKASQLQRKNATLYFQVGFLGREVAAEKKAFEVYKNYRKSTHEATGLSMFPVKVLQKLRGFDEFYHFWGAEDTDMHVRLKNAGYKVEYYDKEILMLHQWHPSYRSTENTQLTQDLQISGIVSLNHQHLKNAVDQKITLVNPESWGEICYASEIKNLMQLPVNIQMDYERRKLDDLLYGQLPVLKNTALKIEIKKDSFQDSFKYRAKKILRKKVPEYYSLKEINDKVLLHLISFYRNRPYIYKVNDALNSIVFAIRF